MGSNAEVIHLLVAVLNVFIMILADISLVIISKLVNNPKKTRVLNQLNDVLPVIIKDAEDKGITGGTNKKNYVVEMALSYLANNMHRDYEFVRKNYSELISTKIELILSTPQKKEVSLNEKTSK